MDLTLPTPAQWVDGKKTGTRVLADPWGNRFMMKSKYGNKVFYKCLRAKDLDCPVRMTLDTSNDMITRLEGVHCHDSDLMKEWVKAKTKDAVRNAVENPTIAPRTVFMDLSNDLLSEPSTLAGLPHLPKMKSMARAIQKKRKQELGVTGSLPKTWDEMEVPEE